MRVKEFAEEQYKAAINESPVRPSVVCYAEGYRNGVTDILKEQKEDIERIESRR